ncbi:MAG: hypothetical protein ACREBV_03190, partial [Candidatus Zixiibacteriota bacterium]
PNGSTTFSQLVMPLNGFVPIKENLEVLFYAVGSVNDLETVGQQTGLTGAGDVRLQANQSLSNDHVILSLGLNLPSGKHRLDYSTDTTMLQVLSRNYLQFSMRRFGQGFGANFLIGGAAMIGEFRGGAGILFEYAGEYHPFRGLGKYDPGNFVSLTAGLDRKLSNSAIYGDITATLYTPDRFEGRKAFKQSPEAQFRIGGSYQKGLYLGDIRFSYLWRGRNTQYDSDETIEQQFQLFGNEFLAQLNLTRQLSGGWAITPTSEIKIIDRNEGIGTNELGSCHYVGMGAAVAKTFNGGLTASAGTKYFVGSANSGAISIDGVQIFTGLSATF